MENHQHQATDTVFACPMHPEITGKEGDKCSKCGMKLVPGTENTTDQYEVKLNFSPKMIEAGKAATLNFTFNKDGVIVPLEVSHEMKVHLMVVNEELTWFQHLHPEQQADGSYRVSETFPAAGKYLMFSDYKPQGAPSIVDKKEIEVKGAVEKIVPNIKDKFVSVVDGYTLTLENGNDLKTDRSQSLKITVQKDGKKLTDQDIEQYLGAAAHIVMISQVDKDFLHVHPMDNKDFLIYAQTNIKKAGFYRMWIQFKTNGKVHTADFSVTVQQGEKSNHTEHQH